MCWWWWWQRRPRWWCEGRNIDKGDSFNMSRKICWAFAVRGKKSKRTQKIWKTAKKGPRWSSLYIDNKDHLCDHQHGNDDDEQATTTTWLVWLLLFLLQVFVFSVIFCGTCLSSQSSWLLCACVWLVDASPVLLTRDRWLGIINRGKVYISSTGGLWEPAGSKYHYLLDEALCVFALWNFESSCCSGFRFPVPAICGGAGVCWRGLFRWWSVNCLPGGRLTGFL